MRSDHQGKKISFINARKASSFKKTKKAKRNGYGNAGPKKWVVHFKPIEGLFGEKNRMEWNENLNPEELGMELES